MASQETLLDLSSLIKRIGKKKKIVTYKKVKGKRKKITQEVYVNNKESEHKIEKQKQVLKNLEKKNAAINYQRKKLKQEQVTRGVTPERVKKIDLILKQLQPIPIEQERNYLNMIEGKDFNFIIDTGFERTKIKLSKLLKESNPSLKYSKAIEDSIISNIDEYKKKLTRKNISKVQKKVFAKKIHVLEKLLIAAEYNSRVASGGDDEQLDGEYPMLVLIVGESIRINA